MWKSDVLAHFQNSPSAVAAALEITTSAVSAWGEIVPEGSAYKLQVVTGGALQVDPALYRNRPKRGQVLHESAA